jgi:hypothetical protein
MVGTGVREAIVGDRRITGLTSEVIAAIAAEIAPVWEQQWIDRLVSRPRSRAVGAGAKHRLVFIDRLLVTLVNLRHAVTHDVLACWFGVDRSTVTRAISEIRPLLAARGCSIAPGVRLRTLAEVVDHLGETGQVGIVDGTEIRVRRPAEGSPGRDRLVSGKTKQNSVKTMVNRRRWARAVLQPGSTGQSRGHHPRPTAGSPRSAGHPGRDDRARRRRVSRARDRVRRTGRDTAAPKVQTELAGLV